jgi:rubredoxin
MTLAPCFRHGGQAARMKRLLPDSCIAMSQSPPDAVTLRKWMCVVCGFIYDEVEGLPEEGIPPGTRWDDIPDTWTCPDCGVTKDDFEMIEM